MNNDKFTQKLKNTIENQDKSDVEKYAKADSVIGGLSSIVDTKKVIRKSSVERQHFSMPPDDYALIDVLRVRAINAGRYSVSKSEIMRAALHVLSTLKETELLDNLNRLQNMRSGN